MRCFPGLATASVATKVENALAEDHLVLRVDEFDADPRNP